MFSPNHWIIPENLDTMKYILHRNGEQVFAVLHATSLVSYLRSQDSHIHEMAVYAESDVDLAEGLDAAEWLEEQIDLRADEVCPEPPEALEAGQGARYRSGWKDGWKACWKEMKKS